MSQLTAPTNLVAAFSDGPRVLLSWTSNDLNATAYTLERTESGTYSVIASVPSSNSSVEVYTDTNVQVNKTYSYRVKAINVFGFYEDSDYLGPVSVETTGTTITELQIPLGILFSNTLNEYSLMSIEAEVPIASAPAIIYTSGIVLGKAGLLSVGTNVSFEIQLPSSGTFVNWALSCKTAPLGADLIVDFKLDSVSLWATHPSLRPKVLAGTNRNTGTSFDNEIGTVGQVLTLDIVQTGINFAGDTLTAQLGYSVNISS